MAKLSKEEIKKRLKSQQKSQQKEETEEDKPSVSGKRKSNTQLISDLKKLFFVTSVVVVLLIGAIIVQSNTDILKNVADVIYNLANLA